MKTRAPNWSYLQRISIDFLWQIRVPLFPRTMGHRAPGRPSRQGGPRVTVELGGGTARSLSPCTIGSPLQSFQRPSVAQRAVKAGAGYAGGASAFRSWWHLYLVLRMAASWHRELAAFQRASLNSDASANGRPRPVPGICRLTAVFPKGIEILFSDTFNINFTYHTTYRRLIWGSMNCSAKVHRSF